MPYLGIFGLEFKNICHILKQHLRICLIAKFCEIMKMAKFETKKALRRYFCARVLKNFCHVWNQQPQICLTTKFREKTKIPKFGTKNGWFGYFDQNYLIWVKKYIVIFEISSLEFVFVKFGAKIKILKFENKNSWLKYENDIVIFEISTLEFV